MAYIGKSIESGTFAVLDTSGNTYNGSNTTFSLGTQVGSPAQLLVSHDGVIQKAGTDYSLASGGTQITFSTAPASGASIFIVEISGAVGGTVTPSDNSVGITQLNVSDGSNGQALTTNGSGTLSFASVGLAGIDDQSSSNDDQLTITDTAVVINEDSDDVDFRVETNGNANALFVNGGGDRVGIGADPDQGLLHVKTADTSATAGTDSDELVLENSAAGGLTILSGNTANGKIAFGDDGDSDAGAVIYEHDGNNLRFHANGAERMRIRDDGEVLIGTTNSSNVLLKVEQSANEALGRFFNSNTSASATLFKIKCDNSTGSDYISFNIDKAGSSVLNIEGDGDVKNTNNSYGSISDERIKKDITDANSQWDDIKALKIKNYKLKTDDESPTQLGVIAQDLETDGMNGLVKESRPEAYLVNAHSDFGTLEDGTADNGAIPITDEEGKITGYEKVFTEGQKVKSVKYSVLYMKAIKALQEAMTRIETLEAKVKALEEG